MLENVYLGSGRLHGLVQVEIRRGGGLLFEADEFVGIALLGHQDGGQVGPGLLEVIPFPEFQIGRRESGRSQFPGLAGRDGSGDLRSS